jgi:hypothetical protein
MPTNLDRYQADLDALIERGDDLFHAVQRESRPKEFDAQVKKHLGDKAAAEFIKELPQFNRAYQPWYSEAKSLIRQLLPDRLDDFVRHYEKPKSRKAISYENYTIEDALQGLRVTRGYEKEVVVDSDAAIPHVQQQLEIVKSAKRDLIVRSSTSDSSSWQT